MLFMRSPGLYVLALVVLVVLPVGVGTWRGFRRARNGGGGDVHVNDRNPGPEGGYGLIAWSLGHMPGWFNRTGMDLGAWTAWATLPRQRAYSREYLRLALGREPAARDLWRHFRAYTEYFIQRLRICAGREPGIRFAVGEGDELRAWIAQGRAALYGTMHVGHSDLLGFLMANLGGRVHMVRKKVGNSDDVGWLADRYSGGVSFIWINDWSRLVLAMNDALRAGRSLAMQCDRPEYSSKLEAFDFFGGRRLFPFTIYHLGIMHGLPVGMSYAVAAEEDPEAIVVHMPPMFHPRPGHEHRAENFDAARTHFQAFLAGIETQLRRTPFVWFNFTPMNPPVTTAAGGTSSRRRLAVAKDVSAAV